MELSRARELAAQAWQSQQCHDKVMDPVLADEFAKVLMANSYDTPEAALKTLKKAFKADAGFAWTWHCNIAAAMLDSGLTATVSNLVAALIMQRCFDVETKEPT